MAAAGMPSGKTPKASPILRGQRQPMAISMPPDLVAEIDAIAAAESRSRAKMIEFICRQYVQTYRRRAAAAA